MWCNIVLEWVSDAEVVGNKLKEGICGIFI